MAKSHVVRLTITNDTGYPLIYVGDWFDSGRLADHYSWPKEIHSKDHQTVECYEKDWSLAGCSGYVQYSLNGVTVTFGFSNPKAGDNKLGVGTDGKGVWEDMSDHDYKSFVEDLNIRGEKFDAICECSGGDVNVATVKIIKN